MALINRSFKLFLSIIALNGLLLPIKSQLLSGTSVILGSKHYYIETTHQANFFEAAHTCAQYDMTLASIENKAEYNSLFSTLKTGENLDKKFWLSGISRGSATNQIFSWLGTGKLVNYWPDTVLTDASTCLSTIVTSFFYEAADCVSSKLYYICEKPVEPNCGKLGQCRYTYSFKSN